MKTDTRPDILCNIRTLRTRDPPKTKNTFQTKAQESDATWLLNNETTVNKALKTPEENYFHLILPYAELKSPSEELIKTFSDMQTLKKIFLMYFFSGSFRRCASLKQGNNQRKKADIGNRDSTQEPKSIPNMMMQREMGLSGGRNSGAVLTHVNTPREKVQHRERASKQPGNSTLKTLQTTKSLTPGRASKVITEPHTAQLWSTSTGS